MRRTIDQRRSDVTHRILVAINRGARAASLEEKERASRWVRAWQKEYWKLSPPPELISSNLRVDFAGDQDRWRQVVRCDEVSKKSSRHELKNKCGRTFAVVPRGEFDMARGRVRFRTAKHKRHPKVPLSGHCLAAVGNYAALTVLAALVALVTASTA